MSMSRDENALPQVRDIPLPDGSVLTLTFNEQFCEKVRRFFDLDRSDDLTDDHLKEFFAASLAAI